MTKSETEKLGAAKSLGRGTIGGRRGENNDLKGTTVKVGPKNKRRKSRNRRHPIKSKHLGASRD